jgi:hypothetical protein
MVCLAVQACVFCGILHWTGHAINLSINRSMFVSVAMHGNMPTTHQQTEKCTVSFQNFKAWAYLDRVESHLNASTGVPDGQLPPGLACLDVLPSAGLEVTVEGNTSLTLQQQRRQRQFVSREKN